MAISFFFQQVSSEIPSHTAFDNEGERPECEDQCEFEKKNNEKERENIGMKTAEGRESRPVLKETGKGKKKD